MIRALTILLSFFSNLSAAAINTNTVQSIKVNDSTYYEQQWYYVDWFGRKEIRFRWYTSHIVTPNASGVIEIIGPSRPDILPGDHIRLNDNANTRAVFIYRLNGTRDLPIKIYNHDDQLYLNNINRFHGDGLGYGSFFQIVESHNLEVGGRAPDAIYIQGPTTASRAVFFGLQIDGVCSNLLLENFFIRDGGTGVQIKCHTTQDSLTWRGRSPYKKFTFKNIRGRNIGNEFMYIMSTDMFKWLCNHGPNGSVSHPPTGQSGAVIEQVEFYDEALPDTTQNFAGDLDVYKQGLIADSIEIVNCDADSVGNDGIQVAHARYVTIRDCDLTNWGMNNVSGGADGHVGGITLGNEVRYSLVEDCTLTNAPHGRGIWHFATGPGHEVNNVLIWKTYGGVWAYLKGGQIQSPDNDFHVTFNNVTFCDNASWEVGIRISCQMGAFSGSNFNNCLFIDVGQLWNGDYFHGETYNGHTGKWNEGAGGNANKKFTSIAAAGVDPNYFLQPLPGSTITDEGYRVTFAPLKRLVKIPMGTSIKRSNK